MSSIEFPEGDPRRAGIAADLPLALARGELFLAFQPICEAETCAIAAFEALLRWRHPKLGVLLPDAFIPLAEENGLIRQLGGWVLDEACTRARDWPGSIGLAVNVAGAQVAAEGFTELVVRTLERTGFPPERLELELTETSRLDLALARPVLERLQALGIRVAIDDFGMGYSGLSRVIEARPDHVKLDKGITARIDTNRDAALMVRAVVNLCREIGIGVTIEGIERLAQFVILKELRDCRLQGYFFSRPVDADKLDEFLAHWR